MQDAPGVNCCCGKDEEALKEASNRCSECGTRLVWRSYEGGVERRECPDCE